VPPAVALLNYISGFSPKQEFSRGFLINFAVYLCTCAQCVFNLHVCYTTNSLNIKKRRIRRNLKEEKNKKRITKRKVQKTIKRIKQKS
jgi:hypothetical protein